MHTKRLAHLETEECDLDMLAETQSLLEIFFGWLSIKPIWTAVHRLMRLIKS